MDNNNPSDVSLLIYQSMINEICYYSFYKITDIADYIFQPASVVLDIAHGKCNALSIDAEIELIRLYNICIREGLLSIEHHTTPEKNHESHI